MCLKLTGVPDLVAIGFESLLGCIVQLPPATSKLGQVPYGVEEKKMGLHCGCLQVLPKPFELL